MDDVSKGPSLTDYVLGLDIDETMVHTMDSIESLETLGIMGDPNLLDLRRRVLRFKLIDAVSKRGQGQIHDMWSIKRPHLDEFLIFAKYYFKSIFVWSAGKRKYVDTIVKEIFRDIGEPPIILNYDDCEEYDNCRHKPLIKLNQLHPKIGPIEKIFILDDRMHTFQMNPTNGVWIPEYSPAPELESLRADDQYLLHFKYWLLQPEVISAGVVNGLDKTNIFQRSLQDLMNTAKKDVIPTTRPPPWDVWF